MRVSRRQRPLFRVLGVAAILIGIVGIGWVFAHRGKAPVSPALPPVAPAKLAERGPPTTLDHPNLILIDIDSLRADRIGLRREGELVAPTLTALAENGTRFTAAFSQSGWTTPALLSILRGRPPLLYSTEGREMKLVGRDERTVPSILQIYGYQTVTIFALQRWMDDPRAGLGFQKAMFLSEESDEDLDGKLVAQVDDYLSGPVHEPFFLLLHDFDVDKFPSRLPLEALHHYTADAQGCEDRTWEGAYSQLAANIGPEATRAHLEGHYDATVHWYDAALARILARFEADGLLERSIVIMTSNHGEDLAEHYDSVNHCSLYDSDLHIPLIVVDPRGKRGSALSVGVQTMDIGPTLLEYAGVVPEATMAGRSLVGLVRGTSDVAGWPARPLFSATNMTNLSVRADGWKLVSTDHPAANRAAEPCGKEAAIAEPVWELYDLTADPQEQHDVYAAQSEKATAAKRDLLAWRDIQAAAAIDAPTFFVGGAAKEALQKQGYWQVVAPGSKDKSSGGAPGAGDKPPPGQGGGAMGPPGQGGVPGEHGTPKRSEGK